MIKTADEIVEIVCEAQRAKLAEIHDATMEFINTTIANMVERAAKDCRLNVSVRVDENVDRNLIKSVLEKAGYEVTIKGYDVRVDWMTKYIKRG